MRPAARPHRHRPWLPLGAHARLAASCLLVGALAPWPLKADPSPGAVVMAQLHRIAQDAYDRPEESLQSLEQWRAAWTLPWTPALQAAYDFNRAQALLFGSRYDEALAQAETLRPSAEAHRLLVHALVSDRQGRQAQAEQLAQQALEALPPACAVAAETHIDTRSERRADSELLRRSVAEGCDLRAIWLALRLIARGHDGRGAYALSLGLAQRSLRLARALQDRPMIALSLGTLTLAQDRNDQLEAARHNLGLALQEAQGDEGALARVKVFESILAANHEDRSGQLRGLNEALDLALKARAWHLAALIRTNLADGLMKSGHPAEALALAREALPVLTQLQDLRLERRTRNNLAVALILTRQFEAARQELQRLEQLRSRAHTPQHTGDELRELGEAWAEVGQWQEALRTFHEERALDAQTQDGRREEQRKALRLKYDSEHSQASLQLLQRDRELTDRQLGNSRLAERLGMALALLLSLTLALLVLLLAKVRSARRQLEARQTQLRTQSERDPLTQLANRRSFLGLMAQQAPEQFQGGLLMVDIDQFKAINDQHGHAVGDSVICDIARRLSQVVREQDLVVRWGGEEFLVCMPDISPAQLSLLAQRVLRSLAEPAVASAAGPLQVRVSIGCAHFPLATAQQPMPWEKAVSWVDMALYAAKQRGRARAVSIQHTTADSPEAQQSIEADFEAACLDGRVQLQEWRLSD